MSIRLLFLACVTSVLVGCGGGDPDQKRVFTVSGTVKYQGQPLTGAKVIFAPLDEQPTAYGMTNEQGIYNLSTYGFEDGAAAGNYKVIVTKSVSKAATSGGEGEDEHAGDDGGDGEHSAATKAAANSVSMVPDSYADAETSPWSATVAEGDNVLDHEIQ